MTVSKTFIRLATDPRRDLARGYSSPMGAFGDESQAHAGLSSYEVDLTPDGIESAVEQLDSRMGVVGSRVGTGTRRHGYVVVMEGTYAGDGPECEALCRPHRIVWMRRCDKIKSVESLVATMTAALVKSAEVAS